jgi:hypothetical protein
MEMDGDGYAAKISPGYDFCRFFFGHVLGEDPFYAYE